MDLLQRLLLAPANSSGGGGGGSRRSSDGADDARTSTAGRTRSAPSRHSHHDTRRTHGCDDAREEEAPLVLLVLVLVLVLVLLVGLLRDRRRRPALVTRASTDATRT